MSYLHRLLLFQPVTPLHVGCGHDIGVVDLPVIRERTTGYPFLSGSGVRGSLRSRFEAVDAELAGRLFGPHDWKEGDERYAGCVAVHDARLLLFPVRSDHRLFLWLTCRAALDRLARELAVFAPGGAGGLAWVPATAPARGRVVAPDGLAPGGRLHLEEIAFDVETDPADGLRDGLAAWADAVGGWLGLGDLAERTLLLADEDFVYFVRHATLVQQHNRLSSAKTVQGGALFSLEAVPPEAVFYGFLGATGSRWPTGDGLPAALDAEAVLAAVQEALAGGAAAESGAKTGQAARPAEPAAQPADPPAGVFHFGGDESTGLGVTRLIWVPRGGSADAR
jgi:CRISPR-associated protein Cmr4